MLKSNHRTGLRETRAKSDHTKQRAATDPLAAIANTLRKVRRTDLSNSILSDTIAIQGDVFNEVKKLGRVMAKCYNLRIWQGEALAVCSMMIDGTLAFEWCRNP